ncbi:hypothetical protein BDZ45DRAFT_689865 [Acephala macrosclerotiorum]|nr:hypothetical protein BDZ45DRAFT_689865 [Acephala macrosclerotiorum]
MSQLNTKEQVEQTPPSSQSQALSPTLQSPQDGRTLSRLSVLLSSLLKLQTTNIGVFIPTTFTCFSKLPIELRFKIWRFASFNNPQIIPLHIKVEQTASLPIPAILLACHESRGLALQMYIPCQERFNTWENNSHRTQYINFAVDVLRHEKKTSFEPPIGCLYNFSPIVLLRIQHLGFQVADAHSGLIRSPAFGTLRIWPYMMSLQVIHIQVLPSYGDAQCLDNELRVKETAEEQQDTCKRELGEFVDRGEASAGLGNVQYLWGH